MGQTRTKKAQTRAAPLNRVHVRRSAQSASLQSNAEKSVFSCTESPLLWKSNGSPESSNRRRKVWRTSSLLLLLFHPAVPRAAAAAQTRYGYNRPPPARRLQLQKIKYEAHVLSLDKCPLRAALNFKDHPHFQQLCLLWKP